MEGIKKKVEDKELRIEVDSNEESLFSLLKVTLEKESDVDIVGVYKGHHLFDKTEVYLKVKKGDPLKIFKKGLKDVKKDLLSKKVK